MSKIFAALAYLRARPMWLWIVALLFAGAAGWLALGGNGNGFETITVARAPFEAAVNVSGKVVPAREVSLGFSQSGRVSRVLAAVGSRVGAGVLLAEVENGELGAAVLQKQAALKALEEGTRIEELAVKETALQNADAELLEAARDAYRAADDAIHSASDQFFSNPRSNPQLTFSTTNTQLAIDILTARAALEDVLARWQSAVASEGDGKALATLSRDNLGAIAEFLRMANSVLIGAIPNTAVSASALADYSADIASARNAVNAAQSALVADLSAQATAEKNLALSRAGSRATDIDAARADLQAARAQLAKTRITAPFAGTVTHVDIEAGEVASGGSTALSMIGGTFQVEAYVPEVEIAALEIGDKALIYLDAYGPSKPFLAAVAAIDPAETLREGVSTYKTTLQFADPDSLIRSGMTADILITTDRKEDAIIIPTGALVKRGNKAFVMVKDGDKAAEREVTLGLSSVGQAEVLSGLSEGEEVILNP